MIMIIFTKLITQVSAAFKGMPWQTADVWQMYLLITKNTKLRMNYFFSCEQLFMHCIMGEWCLLRTH